MVDVKMCFEVPYFTDELREDYLLNEDNRQINVDTRTDMLATLLALYPYKTNEEIAEQLKISVKQVKRIAQTFGIKKSKEYRSMINSKSAKIMNEKRRKEKEQCTKS